MWCEVLKEADEEEEEAEKKEGEDAFHRIYWGEAKDWWTDMWQF